MFKKGITYKQMSKINMDRTIVKKSFKTAEHTVFVFEGFDQLKFNSVQLFIENVRKENPNFSPLLLFYINEVAPKLLKGETRIVQKHAEFDLDFVLTLYKNEFGSGKKIKNDAVSELVNSKFDLAILPEYIEDELFRGVFVQLNAGFKIALQSDENEEFCDLLIDQSEETTLIDTLQLMDKYAGLF